jgi:uncharacterized protein (TIGR02246 family)
MIDDREQITGIYSASAAALAAGDIGALSMYYMGDAVQLPPDAPPLVGWEAIRGSLEKELDGIAFDSTMDVVETVVVGECAYVWGQFRATVSQQPDGRRTITSGSFLDVLRRHTDGSWKIVRSAWSNHELDSPGGLCQPLAGTSDG